MTDEKGRQWAVPINVLTIGRVRDELKLNLLEVLLEDSKLVETLLGDVVDLARVLWLLCKDQADVNTSQEDFYASLSRDALEDGLRGILEGVVNFSPRPLRPAYQKVLEKMLAFRAAEEKRIKRAIDSPEFDQRLDKEIAKGFGPRPTAASGRRKRTGDASNWPASPASTSPSPPPPPGTASAA
jgi:hypothetical protein